MPSIRSSQMMNVPKKAKASSTSARRQLKLKMPRRFSTTSSWSSVNTTFVRSLKDSINRTGLRFTLTPDRMQTFCKGLLEKYGNNDAAMEMGLLPFFQSPEGCSFVLESGIPPETLKHEFLKYLLVASSELETLSIRTLLSMISEVVDKGRMVVYFPGYPRQPPVNAEAFANITRDEFSRLKREERNELMKEWIKKVEEFVKDVSIFLTNNPDIPNEQAEFAKDQKKRYATNIAKCKRLLGEKEEAEEKLLGRFRAAANSELSSLPPAEAESRCLDLFNSIDPATLRVLIRLANS